MHGPNGFKDLQMLTPNPCLSAGPRRIDWWPFQLSQSTCTFGGRAHCDIQTTTTVKEKQPRPALMDGRSRSVHLFFHPSRLRLGVR